MCLLGQYDHKSSDSYEAINETCTVGYYDNPIGSEFAGTYRMEYFGELVGGKRHGKGIQLVTRTDKNEL